MSGEEQPSFYISKMMRVVVDFNLLTRQLYFLSSYLIVVPSCLLRLLEMDIAKPSTVYAIVIFR
jgi:hypothetical protein